MLIVYITTGLALTVTECVQSACYQVATTTSNVFGEFMPKDG